jgi:hypothetical protein
MMPSITTCSFPLELCALVVILNNWLCEFEQEIFVLIQV